MTTTQTTGKTFKQFYDDDVYWNDGWAWVSDAVLRVDGKLKGIATFGDVTISDIHDNSVVEIVSGTIVDSDWKGGVQGFATFFNNWTPTLIIEPVPEVKEEVVEVALCEVPHIFLRPDQLYKFYAQPGCPTCAQLANVYSEEEKK